jgi:enoyl-CoA hydratase/carnithine racemase
MSYTCILYDVRNGVATITLNRADKLNSLTFLAVEEIIAALDAADSDDEVRVIVITGAGRAFSAGADLSDGEKTLEYESLGHASPVRPDGSIDYAHPGVRDGGGLLTLRLFKCLKPVLAAVNGPAAGGGITMMLPADVRFASTAAKFAFVFARRGIVPEAAGSWFLPRIVGVSKALEWCLAGSVVSAEEALAAGLVRSLHAPEDLLPAVYAYAREIVENTAPVSVALTRQMIWRLGGADHPMEAHKLDSRGVYARGRSADAREGVTSFLEKRKPRFMDRVSTDMPDYFPWWDEPAYS